jgi:sialidase-1
MIIRLIKMRFNLTVVVILTLLVFSCKPCSDRVTAVIEQPVLPVMTLKENNPVMKIRLVKAADSTSILKEVVLSLEGTTSLSDIDKISILRSTDADEKSYSLVAGESKVTSPVVIIHSDVELATDTTVLWVTVKLKNQIELTDIISASCKVIKTDKGKVKLTGNGKSTALRTGVALRQHNQDGVDTYRIPGLSTSKRGTLLAIYDMRRDSDRDLQGDIDIGLSRSTDGGRSWEPAQVIMDMHEFGGLPEKYNGVSDACILADNVTGDIYVAGLWMYGVLDPANGIFVEGLTDTSTVWNHQWRSYGSQPGYSIRRSSQFLIVKSTDDGVTWSKPVNVTRQVKKEEWSLLAPAPGAGITLADGTLVFPSEGIDEEGRRFSTITYSKDAGKSWQTGNPAYYNTNECAVVELPDHTLMLNMRERSNRGKTEGNGRAVAVTADLGEHWTEHPSSRKELIEPACMASLYRHNYVNGGIERSVLLFTNPNSYTHRNNFTLKASFDDGQNWPEDKWILLDEYEGNGYSCITAVNDSTIGILYEGSQANLVFQQISLDEIIN